MNNDKRVLIAIVLSIAVWLLYESFLAPPRQPAQPPGEHVTPQQETIAPLPAPPAHIPDAAPTIEASEKPSTLRHESRTITVNSTRYRMRFLTEQAGLISIRLLNYKEKLPPPAIISWFRRTFKLRGEAPDGRTDNFKELLNLSPQDSLPINTAFVYPGGTVSSVHAWQPGTDADTVNALSATAQLVFTGEDQNSLQFSRRYEFYPDEYRVSFDMVVTNTSDRRIEGNPFIEWTARRPAKPSGGLFSMDGMSAPRFVYLIRDNIEKQDLHKIQGETIIEGEDVFWTAIEEKYFICAIIPLEQRPAQIRLSSSDRLVSFKLVYPYLLLEPGQSRIYRFALFTGPRDINILRAQNARLERTIDFGWFDIISKPLLITLNFFNGFLHNYGLSIILLTIVIKILFWPLTNKSFKSMKGMQKLQPEIAALKEKYKDNREEFARQQMDLFRRHKVNPLGGCLPMLLQIPVFIALYRALMDSIELRHANFISFWINDLSAKDPTYIAPLIMGASMFLQQKMTPTTLDPAQARIMMFMPVIFTVMMMNFPSGLVIYWLVNNLISIAQQVYINRKHTDTGGAACSPSTSKPKQQKKR